MGNLFDLIEPAARGPVANDTWRPEAPPCLDGIDDIFVNFETNGLKWYEHDLPIAMSVWAGNRGWYLPFGHCGGGNLSEEQVYAFAQSLKHKHITNANTRFDIHMGRKWGEKMGRGGLDFEAMGCTVSDVGHYAALLDDHRRFSRLDALIPEYLGEQPMARLDESRMKEYSAGAAAPRAIYSVQAVMRLREAMWPKLDAEGLQKVRQLEDDVIFVVCEMEKNSTRINLELLDKWIKDAQTEYHKILMDLFKATGLKINPNSSKDQAKLFHHLHIPFTEFTSEDNPSFTDVVIKAIDHPTIKLLRRGKKLSSINSKLRKYQKCVSSDGILRYALHQLRATKSDDANAAETGTVVGRFTSTEIGPGIGTNIQQVMKPEKQFKSFGDEYFIRELHIPEDGQKHLSVDAEQIQYRIFAHEANNAKVIQAYKDDPWLSFHKMTLKLFRVHKPDLQYGKNKDLNFAKIFVAGPTKLALMLEFITPKQYLELKAQKANRYHPLLKGVLEILKIYDKEIPEADALAKQATHIADTHGFIKSILGRRMRFEKDAYGKAIRGHKALNGRIIMSEADIVKTKAVELHKNRKYTNLLLRFQVHDEFDGDVPDEESKKRVAEILNRQSFNLRVPILWGAKIGANWGACSAAELQKLREEALL